MFGFGRGPQKNASDIQLAIDAIDIAFTRKAIEIFVIVSGDGGFSSLAKKLHEYGYMVIGCAFKRTTNRIFKAVCDDFIWIDEPKDEYGEQCVQTEFTDPILIEFSRKFQPVKTTREQIISEAKNILLFFASNKDAIYVLKNVGLNISIFSQAASYRIINFNYFSLGFTRFVDFIRYVANDTQLKMVHNPPSEYRLLFKYASIKNFKDVPAITRLGEIHTVENYNLLLSKGTPVFKIQNNEILLTICRYLSENKLAYQGVMLGDVIDGIGSVYDFGQNEIKGCVLSLVSGGCFMRESEDAKFSEQKLSFIPQSSEQTITVLKASMHQKLQTLLGNVNEEVFSEIIR